MFLKCAVLGLVAWNGQTERRVELLRQMLSFMEERIPPEDDYRSPGINTGIKNARHLPRASALSDERS